MEEQIRKTAIERLIKGESPKDIYTSLKRSKKWFFKWLKRYRSGEKLWFRDQSRAPRKSPQRISETERQRIIATRKRLEAETFAQVGTSAIKWEMRKAGYRFPSDSTIHRVLKHEGLIKKNFICAQRGGIPLFHRGTGF
jgi:putative transposase